MNDEIIESHRDYLYSEIDRILSDENIQSTRLTNIISLVELKTLIHALRNLEGRCRFQGVPVKFNPRWRDRV